MKNSILGTVAGLLVGSVGALAYSHYAGDGNLLATLEAQLDSANSKLAQAQSQQRFLKEQNNSSSQQVDQLVASNEELKKQVSGQGDGTASTGSTTSPTSVFDPNLIRGIMGMMRGMGGPGGFRSPEQRMFLLQNRLKLDPDQAKAIKTAMDADNQARRDAFRQARQNGTRPDPAALAAINSLDKTLQSVLSPQQQAQYQQVQDDEKTARAESNATAQVDNVVPLLQLSDDQKQKMVNALYQQQLSAPDLNGIMANPNAIQNLTQQGQSMQTTMKQVLTPDQYGLYQQSEQIQQQAFGNFGGQRGGNGNGPGGGGGGGNGPGGNQAGGGQTVSAPTAASTPAAATSVTASTGTNTTPTAATSTTTSTGTTTPGATTNAASATPPVPQAN